MIACGAVSDIAGQFNQPDIGIMLPNERDGIILRAVIHNDDVHRAPIGLGVHGLECLVDPVDAVEGWDDDRDIHSRHSLTPMYGLVPLADDGLINAGDALAFGLRERNIQQTRQGRREIKR